MLNSHFSKPILSLSFSALFSALALFLRSLSPLSFSALFLRSLLRSRSLSRSVSPLSLCFPLSFSLCLSSKIILHTHNVVFIRRMTSIGVLPDFSNNRISVESYQAVTLTLREFNGLTFRVMHELAFLVVV